MSFEFEFDSQRRDGSGIYGYFIAGETITSRQTVYLHTDGRVYLTDASDSSKMPCLGMARDNAIAGGSLRIMLHGFIGDASWTWTVGATLFISEVTPGEMTETSPITPDVIQEAGEAHETDLIYFAPKFSSLFSAVNEIIVRKNSGANVGQRPRLNFIEGANISLTIADDAPNTEIDITIAATGIGAHAATHEPGGADEVNDIDISNSGTNLSAHKSRHVTGGADPFAGGDLLDATARVGASKNGGADVGARRSLNFIEGANITLTIADDAGNEEIDITIASSGGSGGDLSQLFPASDPDGYKGNFPSMVLVDGVENTVRQVFHIPNSITTIVEALIVVIPDGTGNLDWSAATDFGQIAGGEQYNANSDTASGTTAVTNGEIEGIDISASLTGATAKDIVGIEFTRDGDDALDTVGASVHFIGIWIRGT